MAERDNFLELSLWIIKMFRGDQSQAEFSRNLGYTFNIANRWESGTREFYWEDFLKVCATKNIQVSQILEEVTSCQFSEVPLADEVFNNLTEFYTEQEFSNLFSKSQTYRLKNGLSKLRFADFLKILDYVLRRCERLCRTLFPNLKEESFSEFFKPTTDYIELVSTNLNYSFLRKALNLKCYKALPEHSDQMLADLLDISTSEVHSRLLNLQSVGAIELHDKLFRPTITEIDTRTGNKGISRKIHSELRKKIQSQVENSEKNSNIVSSAYLIYETNVELEKEVFRLTNKLYMEVSALVHNYDRPQDLESLRCLSIDFYSPLKNRDLLK